MRSRDSGGQTLVEFALTLPIIILMMLGVFDLGRAVFVSSSLSNAAREGARFAIVNQYRPSVEQRVTDLAFFTDVDNISSANFVNFYRVNADGSVSSIPCSAVTVGCVAVVRVQATWTAVTPLLSNLLGPITMEGKSELPVEFVCPNPSVAVFSTAASCPKQP